MRAAAVLTFLGVSLTVIGVGLVYVPAALILAGIATTGFGTLVIVGTSTRRSR